jgi:hypothetical protein
MTTPIMARPLPTQTQNRRRRPSGAPQQIDLFAELPSTLPPQIPLWQQLPNEIRASLTSLLARLLLDYAQAGGISPTETNHDL